MLAWLGRQGTRAVATLVVLGIALPPVGAVLKPYLAEAVFVLLCIAFMRIDAPALGVHLRRPGLVLAATAWTALGIPFLVGLACRAAGLDARAPDLLAALMVQAIASPMMAAPALAALMGLDAALVLLTLVAGTALVPLTAPFFAAVFVGAAIAIPPLALAAKLAALLAGAALVGAALRRLLGAAVIERERERIDGCNIIVLFVFVAAVMEGVAARFLADPVGTLALAALAFGVFFAVLLLTGAVFAYAGRSRALALGLVTSQRNMGLMLAAAGGAVPDLVWFYVAVSQFPIYLSPQLLQPLARRVLAPVPLRE
jgi:BASS family bile acid:Na+ symporter